MIGHFDAVLSDQGKPILTSVTVYLANMSTKATIYSNIEGTIEKDNPFQTDSLGRFQFFARSGRYDIEVSGVGVTTYKIEDMFLRGPYVDVREYSSLQAALTAMTSGGVLMIPQEDYMVEAAAPNPCLAVANDNITILGLGNGSRIYTPSITDVFKVTGKNVRFVNLMIEGDGTVTDDGSIGPALVDFYQTYGGGLFNCYLKNPHTYGVFIKESYNVNLENNTIEGNYSTWPGTGHTYHAAIGCQAAANSHYRGNRILKCVQGILLSASGTPLNIDGESSTLCRGLIIEANKFYNSMNHHVYSTDGRDCIFRGNLGHTTYDGSGFKITNYPNTLEGNIVKYSHELTTMGGDGFALTSVDGSALNNNRALYNDKNGFSVKTSKGIVICGGVAAYNGYHGVRLQDGVLDSIVGYILCRNNGQIGAGDGVRIDDTGTACLYNEISGVVSIDDQGTPTQQYGIREMNNGNYNHIHGARTRGNVTDGISHVGANTVEADNFEV